MSEELFSKTEIQTAIANMQESIDILMTQDATVKPPIIIGIQNGGVELARRIHDNYKDFEVGLGLIHPVRYRDDKANMPDNTPYQSLDFHKHGLVYLVDDQIQTGRTARAAISMLSDCDFKDGLPPVKLITLFDLGYREMPIEPDVVGIKFELEPAYKMKVGEELQTAYAMER